MSKDRLSAERLLTVRLLTVRRYIFSAFIGQKDKRTKSKLDELFVEWVQFTKRWDMKKLAAQEKDISLKRAVRWNESADDMGFLGSRNFDSAQRRAKYPLNQPFER